VTAPVSAPEAVDDELSRLAAAFDEPFWKAAGWDESLRLVRPDPEHPVLGWPRCVIPGCDHRSSTYGGICPVCRRRCDKTPLSMQEFIAAAQKQPPVRGARRRLIDRFCLVDGCPRPQNTSKCGQCNAHRSQCRDRFTQVTTDTISRFLSEPDVRALSALGPCIVPACTRLAENHKGLCISHQARWKRAHTEPAFDFEKWLRSEPGISRCGVVNLRALPELVTWQLLIAVQRRTQQGSRVSPDNWDHVARYMRSTAAPSLLSVDANEVRVFEVARLLRHLQREARLAVQTWEHEQRGVVWDSVVLGTLRNQDFGDISEP
jgi:hypothetical protein